MSEDDDADTPPPMRVPSEAALRIPIDGEWLHQWRKENVKDARHVNSQLTDIKMRLVETSYIVAQHGDQIRLLAQDMAETDKKAETVEAAHHSRIEQLERLEQFRAREVETAEKAESHSIGRKATDAFIAQIGTFLAIVLAAGAYLIAKLYFTGTP